jgi:hypothetical protein
MPRRAAIARLVVVLPAHEMPATLMRSATHRN